MVRVKNTVFVESKVFKVREDTITMGSNEYVELNLDEKASPDSRVLPKRFYL